MSNYANYVIIAGLIAFFLWRWMRFQSVKRKLPQLLNEGALIVDVRSPSEYSSGHVQGSINIPVQDLGSKAGTLDKTKTILLCCASGSRSGMAAAILKSKGFKNVINAGPWGNLAR